MRRFAYILGFGLAGCAAMLPRGQNLVEGPWESFAEAQQAFDRIVPYRTTVADLHVLKLDPERFANITLLNYSDVLRRFLPSPSIDADDLDTGVKECIAAKAACRGLEIRQLSIRRKRLGNFWADFFNFRRHTDVTGWRFEGVLLMRNDIVIYKLTGGQPIIHEIEDNKNPLGPLQSFGESRVRSQVMP